MLEDFEVYKGQASRVVSGSFVTIQKSGILSLSLDAYTALGEPESVELLFSRSTRVIGLRKADPHLSHAYRVRKARGSASYLVSGRGFVGHYNVGVDKAMRYPAVMSGDVLTVDLKAELADASKRRG